VRIGLFAKALPSEQVGKGLTAAGALGAVSAAEAFTQAPIFAAASGLGAVPWWSVIAVVGVGAAVVALTAGTSGRVAGRRLRRLPAPFRALAASPRGAVPLLLWSTAATAGRVFAAAAIAAALGAASPLEAGVIVTAVLGLATAVPITPGNVG